MSTVAASNAVPARATFICASAHSPLSLNVVAPRVSIRPLTPTTPESSVAGLVRTLPATSSTTRSSPQA